MFVFRKIWRDLFSYYLRFEIGPFLSLPASSNSELNNLFKAFAILAIMQLFNYAGSAI